MQGKIVEGKSGDDRVMVIEVEGMVFIKSLGGILMLRFVRAAILVCVVWWWWWWWWWGGVFLGFSLSVMDLEYSGVGFWLVGGDIFRLGGGFVEMAVEVVVEVEDS